MSVGSPRGSSYGRRKRGQWGIKKASHGSPCEACVSLAFCCGPEFGVTVGLAVRMNRDRALEPEGFSAKCCISLREA